jgi:hypothetical protein
MKEPAKVLVMSDQQADTRAERPRKPPVLPEPVPIKKAISRRSSRRLGCVICGVAAFGMLGLAAIGLIVWLIVRGLNSSAPVIPADKWQALEVPNRVRVLLPGPNGTSLSVYG